VVRWREP